MKILLIGNGFDIAHDLPTTYNEFLDFCKKTREIFNLNNSFSINNYINQNKDWKFNTYIKNTIFDAFQKKKIEKNSKEGNLKGYKVLSSNNALNELNTLINRNTWIDYFLNFHSFIGNGWIDFESEISRVIKIIDDTIVLTNKNKNLADHLDDNKKDVLEDIIKYSKKTKGESVGDIELINEFVIFLYKELNRLIRAFEIYIAEFVNKVPISKKNFDIARLNPDHVLSFNYSNTFERIYAEEKKIKYSFIHGKADIKKTVDSSNLVLGIDEFLDENRKDMELELIMFKKYYQRIYKSTSSTYINWLEQIIANNSYKHSLYIFGHSLDITDRDILKLFICNDNIQTKIFYYRKNINDKIVLGKMIKNLVRLIGQDELIRRTGGYHKTIEFIPQKV